MKRIKALLSLCSILIISILSIRSYLNEKSEDVRNSIIEEVRHNSIKYLSITNTNGKELIINQATKSYFYIMEKFTNLSLIEETKAIVPQTTSDLSFIVKFINLDDNLIDKFIIMQDRVMYKEKSYVINTTNLFKDIQTLFKSHDLQEVKLIDTSKEIYSSIPNTEENQILLNDLYTSFNIILTEVKYKDLEKEYIIDESSPPYIIQLIYSTHTDEFLITPKEILYDDKVYMYDMYKDIANLYREQQILFLE